MPIELRVICVHRMCFALVEPTDLFDFPAIFVTKIGFRKRSSLKRSKKSIIEIKNFAMWFKL